MQLASQQVQFSFYLLGLFPVWLKLHRLRFQILKAQPFIAGLAERNIVKGYPDGTYRREESVDRDEFASILQAAFNQPTERRIASGSVYKDVPQEYWAATQIESAYQMGFMAGYPGGYFRPQQPVTKVEALVSLARINIMRMQTGFRSMPLMRLHKPHELESSLTIQTLAN